MGLEQSRKAKVTWNQTNILNFLQRRDSKGSSSVSGHLRYLLRPFTELSAVVGLPTKETSYIIEAPVSAQFRLGSTQSNKKGEG